MKRSVVFALVVLSFTFVNLKATAA